MTTQASAEAPLNEPDAEQVAAFLGRNSGFFEEHPELLAELRLPHSSGAAVSLIERQVQVLRSRNEELKSRLMELVDVARENDRLNERMHAMTLGLLRAGSLAELVDSLHNHLRSDFQADAVALHLPGIGEQPRSGGALELDPDDATTRQMFPLAFGEGQPQCGRLRKEQLDFLFGDQATAVESAAVVPLGARAQGGLLAIGSRELNRFNPCMGTLFLSNLGELLAQLLERVSAGAS